MQNIDAKMIEEIVRKIIMEKINISQDKFEKHIDPSGVIAVKTSTVKLEKFDTGKAEDKVFLKDVLTLKESPRLGCGVMEMKASTFDWTLKYDEVDVILEGTLEIVIDGRRVVGNKGDIIFIPKDSSIQFSASEYAKFIYIVFPANWSEQ
ncbi:cupin domain-containing protein [Crassaminicella indica]|uniref:DUF861 domain-containing protein n=1 Tax=Crassaminicella indica TaxID=2855394 RepID=A0ABX8RHV2_9CLOT|nr:cupin domain-containing protein [Crassaminicella indica]QXM06516.1 DUF861 domain-containing protein [Crassaminicella indica]